MTKKIKSDFVPEVVAYLCNWSGFSEADLLGVENFNCTPSIKIKRIMCSGSIQPAMILDQLNNGSDGVIICGCHLEKCHYIGGSERVEERVNKTKKLLNILNIEQERLRLERISPQEKEKFATIVKDFTNYLLELGPLNKM